MERALLIKNYRNVGIGKSEKLVLNYSLEKGELGNLVIVIGANNSGKSNILDALLTYSTNAFKQQDRTTLDFDAAYNTPELSLYSKDDNGNTYSYKINSNNSPSASFPNSENIAEFNKTDLLQTIEKLQNIFTQYSIQSYSPTVSKELANCKNNLNNLSVKEISDKLVAILNNIKKLSKSYGNVNNALTSIKNVSKTDKVIASLMKTKTNDKKALLELEYSKKYKLQFFPKIVEYSDETVTTSNLKTTPSNIKGNIFFKNLFAATKSNVDEILNTYNSYKETQNRGILTQTEKKLNKNLSKIEKDFNKIYFLDNNKYSFKLTFETEQIFFEIFRDDISLNLDYQSTGFRWFFNLYFNLLCGNMLNPGDILIMDEPATNLHVQGQIELREFLKEFAIKNDITIVLATHSPFLIDINYLDELRVIYTKDGKCYINNDFSAIDPDDADSLRPVKEALTVHNHVLLDPDKKVVFVEGITDYNYMTAFAKFMNKSDIVFLPICGVGKYNNDKDIKEKHKNIIKSLLKLRKSNALLMVDGDAAGKAMEASCKDTALQSHVFNLSAVDPTFKNIENLFSKDDLEKFALKDKHAGTSSLLKTFATLSDFSDETSANFKKLFDYIENI